MSLVLGIHVGHDAACAVVRDGELVAAVQLERISRSKHHAIASLSNVLPAREVLATIGADLDDVDLIVTSLQGASPAGFGLDRPLVEPSFSLFDPFSDRHHVLSHHLAHAHCAAAYAPPVGLAVMVSDLAGSATVDGEDFAGPFSDWYRTLVSHRGPVPVRSECLSLYGADPSAPFTLLHREFRVPRSGAESHVCSLGALYENVTQAVFRRPHTHGSLMAMAAFGTASDADLPMVEIDGETVVFRNDWQHAVFADAALVSGSDDFRLSFAQAASLARRCQEATEQILLAYGRRVARLSGSRHLALAGGTFLNILGNTRLAQSGMFDSVSLPSAPHDAGIAVGCAFHGARHLGDTPRRVRVDRLGPIHPRSAIDEAIAGAARFVTSVETSPAEVAAHLRDGRIIARSAGRSELGPRALGARSLLGSPLLEQNKVRLNRIKGREPWRPVAPVVARSQLSTWFDGPDDSSWMTFSHQIRPEHVHRLAALAHPDGSTRAQTLVPHQDPWLDRLLQAFGELTGYQVLINTSLNGPAEPILETPAEAVAWFLAHDDVDLLLLDDQLVTRKPFDAEPIVRASPAAYVLSGPDTFVVRVGETSLRVRSPAVRALFAQGGATSIGALRSADPTLSDAELRPLLLGSLLEVA